MGHFFRKTTPRLGIWSSYAPPPNLPNLGGVAPLPLTPLSSTSCLSFPYNPWAPTHPQRRGGPGDQLFGSRFLGKKIIRCFAPKTTPKQHSYGLPTCTPKDYIFLRLYIFEIPTTCLLHMRSSALSAKCGQPAVWRLPIPFFWPGAAHQQVLGLLPPLFQPKAVTVAPALLRKLFHKNPQNPPR